MSLILAEETVNTLTDSLSYITISGGTLISGGGQQGGSSGSLGTGSTHYKAWSGTLSYTAGRYYSIVCGDNILTWLMPVSLSSSQPIPMLWVRSNLTSGTLTSTFSPN